MIIKKLLIEMFVIVNHAQKGILDDIVVEIIAKNPVLVRLLTIIMLHDADDRDLDYFVDHANEFIDVRNHAKSTFYGLIENENDCFKRICTILIADKTFTVGAMKIVMERIDYILNVKYNSIMRCVIS